MKCVVVVVDSLGQASMGEPGSKTPLEQARVPTLDRMAARGIMGLTQTVPRGTAGSSEAGMLAALGYDPAHVQIARGTLAAAGLGVELGANDVAFCATLVTLERTEDGTEIMRDAAGGRLPLDEARAVANDLARGLGGYALQLHVGRGAQHVLIWRGGEADVRTTAPTELVDKPVAGAQPSGRGAETLTDVMTRARGILADHVVCRTRLARGERAPTALWLWSAGKRGALPTLHDRFGADGTIVSLVPTVRGAGVLAGCGLGKCEDTGGFESGLPARVVATLQALQERDLVVLHVEAPDDPAYDADPHRRVQVIEQIDEHVVGPLVAGLNATGADWRVLVLGSFAAAVATAEPVPFVVYVAADEHKQRSASRRFHERDAREQGVSVPEGYSLIARMLRP